MDKFEHISHMFNVRTQNKKYENYIVNAIYNRVGNTELMPITQQYVKTGNRYYLMDLYFPQINYGVEVDEKQHVGELHTLADKEREDAIKEAINCPEKRREIYYKEDKNSPLAKMRSYEEIEQDINTCVEEIKQAIKEKEIKEGKKLKWISDTEMRNQIFANGVFNIDDNVNFKGIQEIADRLGYKLYRRGGGKLSNNYFLWVPHLAIVDENGNVYNKKGWTNYIIHNDNGTQIIEIDQKDKLKNKPDVDFNMDRIVFMKMKDKYGKDCCKFVGVFTPQEYFINTENHVERHYTLVSKFIEVTKLKK